MFSVQSLWNINIDFDYGFSYDIQNKEWILFFKVKIQSENERNIRKVLK